MSPEHGGSQPTVSFLFTSRHVGVDTPEMIQPTKPAQFNATEIDIVEPRWNQHEMIRIQRVFLPRCFAQGITG